MDAVGLTWVCTVALLIVLGGLMIVDGRLLPSAPPGRRVLANLIVAATGAVPWLIVAPLLGQVMYVDDVLTVPVAVLGAIAAFLVSVVPRASGLSIARTAILTGVWSVIVFVPVAALAFGGFVAIDHGGALAANVAPGAAALGMLLLRGPRGGGLQRRSLALGIAGVIAVVFGWVAWLAGAELAIDDATAGIVVSGLVGAVGGVAGWMIAQRVAHQATSLNAVAAGAISGVVAVTAGAPLFTPLSAALTGILSGGLAALFTLGRAQATRRRQWSVAGTHLVAGAVGLVVIGLVGAGVGFIFTGQPMVALYQLAAVVVVAAGSMLVAMALWFLVRSVRPGG